MKLISFTAVCSLFILSLCLSCGRTHHNNISLTVSESEHYFTILAHYNEDQQHAVDKCMNRHFGNASNMSFINTRIKANISMDNGTIFYIEKKPGFLNVKFNKEKNSALVLLKGSQIFITILFPAAASFCQALSTSFKAAVSISNFNFPSAAS